MHRTIVRAEDTEAVASPEQAVKDPSQVASTSESAPTRSQSQSVSVSPETTSLSPMPSEMVDLSRATSRTVISKKSVTFEEGTKIES